MKWPYRFVLLSLLSSRLFSASVAVPNASFEQGGESPAGWQSESEGSLWHAGGGATGDRFISVLGTGTDNTYWRSDPVGFGGGELYRLSFQAKQLEASGGTAVTGPVFCNWDIGCPPEEWRQYSTVFTSPDNLAVEQSWLRFGQWHVNGRIGFDDVQVVTVQPVYSRHADLVLGEGEVLQENAYTFNAPLGGQGRNHSRPLAENHCGFNSNRWVFGASSHVVYRHALAGRRLQDGNVSVTVGWYAGGQLVVAARAGDGDWQSLGTLADKGTFEADLPAGFFPADSISIRLSAQARQEVGAADSDPGSFQIHGYQFKATVDGEALSAQGETRYVEVDGPAEGFEVEVVSLGEALPGGRNDAVLRIQNNSRRAVQVQAETVTTKEDATEPENRHIHSLNLRPGLNQIRLPYAVPGTGQYKLELRLPDRVGWSARALLYVPEFYATDYGEILPASTDQVALWRASSGWKVPRTRSLPTAPAAGLQIRAAANEAEATQLVVRPTERLADLRVSATDLAGPNGAVIPSAQVEILEVRYVPVRRPTDKTGVVADWPDPLPPLEAGLTVEPNQNQPLWVRVKVPKAIPAGIYRGSVQMTATGYRAAVPLEVQVYGFELPTRMTCETAFGFSPGSVWRYQNITSPEDRRAVLEKYWQNYSEHHISPYDPAPLDPFSVSWPTLGGWHGGTRDSDTKSAGEASLRVQDDSETTNAAARYAEALEIPPQGVRLRFRYRTASPGHSFIVTLNHHAADGQWMSGRNNDMVIEGDGSWQTFDRTITSFPEGAAAFRITLWATLYADDGHYTGTVWYDDLSVTALETGRPLVEGGGFEPVDVAALVPQFDWAGWDRAMTRAVEEYGFNTVRLRIQGLGGGTFHSRREPSILGYPADSKEYGAAMSSYLGRIEEHLREKGWLDEAYVYWFDEPAPKDYDFVMNGFRTLKRHAPGLRRMLTEQVEEALIDGPNLWCPVSPHFDLERAQERRQAGEDFWWYICTGPKAPYCTLFIDHPGTELRVWLWQTWKRRISGILVWQTNYWTSSAAYPDQPQNPYADPMGWVSGYSTPKGTKRAWGNGDGRFIYPPVAAADANPDGPVLEGPVDSIRWEMLRDGIEDYEYFVILQGLMRQKNAQLSQADRDRLEQLLSVPDAVSEGMTEFTTDPAPIEAHRHQLAEAIEALAER